MKKAMLILLSVAAYVFSLNDVSVPNTFTPSTPARSSEVNANFDTLESRINQNNDTIEQKFIRFSDLESGDSILEKCRMDTARIDHIRSNPEADSMTITRVDINGGTVDGTVIGANSAAAGTFTTVTASDSIKTSGAIRATGTVIGSNVSQDVKSTASPTFVSPTLSGNLTVAGSIIGSGSAGLSIQNNTSDASDTKTLLLCGGGSYQTTRGATIALRGNESTSGYGNLELIAGDGNGTNTGAIRLAPCAYFGTRPANDYYWNFALSNYLTMNTNNEDFYLMNNCYYDGEAWKRRISAAATLLKLDNSGTVEIRTATSGSADASITWKTPISCDSAGNVSVSKNLSADSAVITKGISCTRVNASTKLMADSARIDDTLWVGTTNAVKLYDGWYREGWYLCTLSGFTATVRDTVRFVKIGNQVTLTFTPATGTRNTAGIMALSTGAMPSYIKPARAIFVNITNAGIDGLSTDASMVISPPSTFQITTFEGSGTAGFSYAKCVTYSLQ